MICLGEWLDAEVITYNELKRAIGGFPDVDEEVELRADWDSIIHH
jgi:hypothetical protein